MHVDHALREAGEEARVEQLHVAGEHDQLDAGAREPVGDREIPRAAVAALDGERPRVDAGRARPLERAGLRLVRADGDDLDALAPVDAVEDRLQVRAVPGGEDADPHAASSTG